ncbi:DUF6221 family protein [Streptomyces sp. NPDC058653]|uniref:DUF6221 family protein n=1 Tax=Streptomyces sp. NPDC058653 TaxID=3346576 RepID=UPI00364691DC
MTASLVAFLRARLDEGLETARLIGNTLITQRERMGVTLEAAESQAQRSSRAAEARRTLFEETVVPYLGTAGPGGRNAERQLRLLAWEYTDHKDFDPSWSE